MIIPFRVCVCMCECVFECVRVVGWSVCAWVCVCVCLSVCGVKESRVGVVRVKRACDGQDHEVRCDCPFV